MLIHTYLLHGRKSILPDTVSAKYIRPKVTVHKGAETIQWRKLFKGGNYMRKCGIPFHEIFNISRGHEKKKS